MKKRIRINGAIIFISLLLAIIFPAKLLRLTNSTADTLMETFGMALILFGLLLRIVSRGFKAEHSRGGNNLVLGGPYILVRNPMYLGIFCAAIGVVLSLFHWWVLLIFSVFFINRYLPLIFQEEKLLTKNFGQQYVNYQKKVPRLLPHLSAIINRNVLNYLPLKLSWIKREKASVFILPIGTLAVKYWVNVRYFNFFFFLPHFINLLGVISVFIGFSLFLARHYEGIAK